jgi:hypothetical protein
VKVFNQPVGFGFTRNSRRGSEAIFSIHFILISTRFCSTQEFIRSILANIDFSPKDFPMLSSMKFGTT